MKGQLSAEMLILIAVILAVVAIVALQLLKTGKEASQKIEAKSSDILNATDAYAKRRAGDYCERNEQCQSNSCDTYSGICLS